MSSPGELEVLASETYRSLSAYLVVRRSVSWSVSKSESVAGSNALRRGFEGKEATVTCFVARRLISTLSVSYARNIVD